MPNAFPGFSFNNPLCAHVVFEGATDSKWHNSSGTSSNGRGDSLEQSCLGVGNSKTRTSTINNHLLERIGVTVICPILL